MEQFSQQRAAGLPYCDFLSIRDVAGMLDSIATRLLAESDTQASGVLFQSAEVAANALSDFVTTAAVHGHYPGAEQALAAWTRRTGIAIYNNPRG